MAEADRPIFIEDAALASDAVDPSDLPERRWKIRAAMLSLPLLLSAGGLWIWLSSGKYVSTDNAYVKQNIVAVGSDVGGRIIAVAVRENQSVKAGDLLFRIDPVPYQVAIAQADAAIAEARVKVEQLRTDFASTGADIDSAKSNLTLAEQDLARQDALMSRGFTTKARLQQAQNLVEVARAEVRNKLAEADKARAALATGAQVPGVNPAIAAARAERSKAALALSRTEVRAPIGGRVSQASRLQVGQMLIVGMPALSIVADNRGWVEANFKESQLDRMYPGQAARIGIDAYPGVELKGHVESIGAGTGSQFSILPAQNANGNWAKVTQRVPVRIAIDRPSPRPLIAGLSVDVTVDVRRRGSH